MGIGCLNPSYVTLNYAVSIHAAQKLEDDNLTILDFEITILTGAIVERQRDRQTREVKYIVRGNALSSILTEAVVKIAPGRESRRHHRLPRLSCVALRVVGKECNSETLPEALVVVHRCW